MSYLLLAVLCSVSVSILLKIIKKKAFDIPQVVSVNYLIAIVLTFVLFSPTLTLEGVIEVFNGRSLFLLLALGSIMPTLFIVMANAVYYAGIIRADSANRLSLILPIVAAFTFLGEEITSAKLIGVFFAFTALILLMLNRVDGARESTKINDSVVSRKGGFYLFLIWLGYGVVDILFKEMAKLGANFIFTLLLAFILAAIIMFSYLLFKKTSWHFNEVGAGLLLGGLNFFNIFFYIRAHQILAQNPSLVFVGMNMGVIIFATLLGKVLFKEPLLKSHYLGLILALLAVFYLVHLK